MRKILVFLALCSAAFGQYTKVSATLADNNGQVYQNCRFSASFIGQSTGVGPYLLSGSVFQTNLPGSGCDSSGNLSITLADNNIVQPTPSQWEIDFCDQTGKYCGSATITITGFLQNISTQLKAAAPLLPPPAGAGGGTITGVIAGSGLTGGGVVGSVGVSMRTDCAANQVLSWSGVAWVCSTPAGTGTITGVTANTGLTGGGVSGSVALGIRTDCAATQVVAWNGSAWVCTNNGTGAAGNPVNSVQGNQAGIPTGIPLSTINFTTGLVTYGQLSPAFIGPGVNAPCQVDGTINTIIGNCIDTAQVTNHLASTIIHSNTPERFTVDPIDVNYSPELWLSAGLHTTTGVTSICDSTHVNGWVTEVPIILGSGSLIQGTGRVQIGATGGSGDAPIASVGDMSTGTLICPGNNFPPPIGVPTLFTVNCAATGGGTMLDGTYRYKFRLINNLEGSKAGKSPVAGYSAPAAGSVVCATGSNTGVVTVNAAPIVGVGSPFASQEFELALSQVGGAAGTELVQPTDTTAGHAVCAVQGTFDPINGVNYSCKQTGNMTVLSTPVAGTRQMGAIDTSNAMFVIGARQTVSFNIQFRDLSISCTPVNSGSAFTPPNVAVWNISGEELTGTNDTQISGACGGYSAGTNGLTPNGSAAAFPAAQVLIDTHAPNSTLTHFYLSGGPDAGVFYPLYLDGNADSTGVASGVTRSLDDITIVPKGCFTGCAPVVPAGIYITGIRARVHASNLHFETTQGGVGVNGLNTNDAIQVDNGAYFLGDGIEAQVSTGNGTTNSAVIHFTSTAAGGAVMGICSIGTAGSGTARCTGQGATANGYLIKDETTGGKNLLGTIGYVNLYATGNSSASAPMNGASYLKFMGYAPMTFANLTGFYTCNAANEGMTGAVTDSNTVTFNANIAGGGANHVAAYCNGTNWVVH